MLISRNVSGSFARSAVSGIASQRASSASRVISTRLLTTAAVLGASGAALAGEETKLSALTAQQQPSNEEALEKQLKQKQAGAVAPAPQAPSAPASSNPASKRSADVTTDE